MTARPSADQHLRPLEIAIVGSDLLLAALPGRPLQVAHAIHACGYDLVIPASWGDELVARYGLEALDQAGSRPMVFSVCPKVRSRLMASGTELLPHLISCIAPPAATARYLRALQPDLRLRVTYIGGCPGAADTSIDVRISPAEFLATLEARGIAVLKQPLVFESVIPPDRRRHLSLPGGVPAPDVTASHGFHYSLLIESDDLTAEIAEHLLAIESVLVDPGPSLGCFCAGAAAGGSREAVVALEPPRASLPVIEEDVLISLDLPGTKAVAEKHDTITVVNGEPPPAQQEVPGQGPSDVPSIAEARRRAERSRIAVTPAHARQVTTQSVVGSRPEAPRKSESAKGQGTTEHERAVPVEVSVEPAQRDDDVDVADAPAPPPSVAAPIAVSEEPTPMSTPSDLPIIVTRLAGSDPSPEKAPATSVAVRHRTPVYGILHASRGTGHQRVVARKGIVVPRAYNAIRHRGGEVVTVTAPMEMAEPPIQGHQVVTTTEGVAPSGTANGSAALTGVLHEQPHEERASAGPRRPGRRDSRRIDAQGIGRQSRLWGLLMSILLIAAVTVTLLLIFGG